MAVVVEDSVETEEDALAKTTRDSSRPARFGPTRAASLNANWRDSVRDDHLELALDDDVFVSELFVVDGSLC